MMYLVSDNPTEQWILKQLDAFPQDDYRHWEFQWYLLSMLAAKAQNKASQLRSRS